MKFKITFMQVHGKNVLVDFLYFKLHSEKIKRQHLEANYVPFTEYTTNFLLNSCLISSYSNFNKVLH
jgi:hypothetical protein